MSDFKKMKKVVESLKGLSKAKQNLVLQELRDMIDAIGQCRDCGDISSLSKDGLCESCVKRESSKERLRKKVSDTRKRVLTEEAERRLKDNRRCEEYTRNGKIQRRKALDIVHVLNESGLMRLDRMDVFPAKMPDSEVFVGEPCLHVSYRSKREGVVQGRIRCNLDGVNRLWLYDEDGKPTLSLDTDEDVERFVEKYVDVRPQIKHTPSVGGGVN